MPARPLSFRQKVIEMAWTAAGTPRTSKYFVQTGSGVVTRGEPNSAGGGVNIGGRTNQRWEVNQQPNALNAPAAQTVSDVTDTTATVSWAHPGWRVGQVTYQVQVGVDPYADGDFSNSGTTTTSLSKAITGLTAETAYQVRVVASGVSGLDTPTTKTSTASATFTTEAAA